MGHLPVSSLISQTYFDNVSIKLFGSFLSFFFFFDDETKVVIIDCIFQI